MTTALLLTKTRGFLDEATEDDYLTADIYASFNDSQLEIIQIIAKQWFNNLRLAGKPIPQVLLPCIEEFGNTYTTGEFQIPITDMVVPTSVLWSPSSGAIADAKPCKFTNESDAMTLKHNSLTSDGYFAWTQDSVNNLAVNPIAGASAIINVFYIETPDTVIGVGVNPIIDAVGHDAIMERSLWMLLNDRETQQAQAHLELYGKLMQGLI